MAKTLFPFSLFNTDINVQNIYGYPVVEDIRKYNAPRALGYLLMSFLILLLLMAINFKSHNNITGAVISASVFVVTIVVAIISNWLLSQCKNCGSRLKRVEYKNFCFKDNKYRVNGVMCKTCRVIEIDYCINERHVKKSADINSL